MPKKSKAKAKVGSKAPVDSTLMAALKAIASHKENKGKEVDRGGVERLIELAFVQRKGGGHVWRRFMDVALPPEPDHVRADSMTVIDLPEEWKQRLMKFDDAYTFSWSYSNIPESVVSLIFRKNDSSDVLAYRYLTMCLVGAQNHRRALGFKDGEVFGAALHKSIMKFFVCYWKDDQLTVQPTLRPYNLENFGEFVDLYFIFCKLSEWQLERAQKEFERWDSELESHLGKLKSATANPWSNARSRRRRNIRRGSEREGAMDWLMSSPRVFISRDQKGRSKEDSR